MLGNGTDFSTRHGGNLRSARNRLALYETEGICAGIKLSNKLPFHIKNSIGKTFKREIKLFFIIKVFYRVPEVLVQCFLLLIYYTIFLTCINSVLLTRQIYTYVKTVLLHNKLD